MKYITSVIPTIGITFFGYAFILYRRRQIAARELRVIDIEKLYRQALARDPAMKNRELQMVDLDRLSRKLRMLSRR